MIPEIAFCLFAGVTNRARGSRLFGLTASATIGRVVSMFGLALGVGFLTFNGGWLRFDCITLWAFAALMFWCVWGWDALWGATIGHDPNHSRLWGLAHLALRMILAAPCLIGLAYLTGHLGHAWVALATPLLAIPYYVFGYAFPAENGKVVIPYSEPTVGVLLGAMICGSI